MRAAVGRAGSRGQGGEDIVLDAGVALPGGGATVGDLILRRQVAVDGVLVTQDRAVSVLTYPPEE